ncbi:MAG TPA: SHIRT domain-containing protein [Erysipelotrichaceae bacterium]|nr:SHIRT domain-containing protein [Erysipelotrichaceae bacterium]
MSNQNYHRRRKLRTGIFSSFLALLLIITSFVPLSAAYGDTLAQTAYNDWQIAGGGYTGNAPENKTTVSGDGMIRVQKNVVPTDTENDFQVYLSLDFLKKKVVTYESITSMLELNGYYCGGTGNGFPHSNDDVRLGNGTLNNYVQGSEKPIVFSDTAPTFTLQIWHNETLIAEPKLQLVVPNSVLYLKVGDKYIALENIQLQGGQVYIGGVTPTILPDGSYLVPVYLTDMAYNALFNTIINENTEEEYVDIFAGGNNAYITDPMGGYIVFDGVVVADISGIAPEATTVAGTTVTWTISPKPETEIVMSDPVTTEETTTVIGEDGSEHTTIITTTTQWALNAVEIVYNVHLAVEKAGFTSGTVYDVNGPTVLNYLYDTDGDGVLDQCSVTFPVPTVLGTLYDFSFTKIDEVTGDPVDNASFTLKDSNNKEWSATISGTNGVWEFKNLPWGTYTLTETNPPAGYALADNPTWTLNIGYTEDLKDGNVSNHLHYLNANDIFTGNNDPASGIWYITNAPIFRVTYLVGEDMTYGAPLDSNTPEDLNDYRYMDLVTVHAALTTGQTYGELNGVQIPGVWTFDGWDKTDFNITEDTTINGGWKFTPTTYTLHYEVAGDANYSIPAGGTAPDAVTGIDYDTTLDLAADLTTSWNTSTGMDDGGVPGKWDFTGWSSDTTYTDDLLTKNIRQDETVYGKWEFTAYTYTLTYDVAGDANYGIPAGGEAPAAETDIPYNLLVTLATDPETGWTTSDGTATGIPGTWNFTGWSTDTTYSDNLLSKLIQQDETVYGKWEFTATTYTLNYEVAPDANLGTSPSDALVPADVTGIAYNYDQPVAADLTTSWNTSTGVDDGGIPGEWVFTGWSSDTTYADDLTDKNIRQDETVYGKWEFTAYTYTLTYDVAGDANYGIPAGGEAPAAETDIPYNLLVTLATDPETGWTTSDGTATGIPGTWNFTGWSTDTTYSDNLLSKLIQQDETVYGKWEFTATTYTLNYEVAPDANLGTSPSDALVPADVTGIAYNYDQPVAADLTTSWNTSTGVDDGGIPGEWVFTGWSSDTTYADDLTDKNIRQDETVYGMWEFRPIVTSVTVIKVWDDGNSADRPEAVTVQLLRDGNAYGVAVTLSDANNWSYIWDNLDGRHTWTIDEVDVPSGYIKTVVQERNVWTITNTIPDVPETGDNINITLLIVLMIISGIGTAGVTVYGKKKRLI